MKSSTNQFIFFKVSHLMAVSFLLLNLLFTPRVVFAIDKDAHEDRTELRIKHMHAKLKILPSQEAQWAKVTEVMLADAKTMDGLTQARIEQAKTMTAVDDLKSYGDVMDAHTNGIKKLIPVFADLYAGMSDQQKKTADILFREGESNHKQRHKKSRSK